MMRKIKAAFKNKLFHSFKNISNFESIGYIKSFSDSINNPFIEEKNIVKTDPNFVIKNKINNLDHLDSFILIIDFPNLGGGTAFFINSVISKYKSTNNFLIVRNFDNQTVFNVNEEYELDKKYNTRDSIIFLENIKDKIIKIFVNHIIGHDQKFIDKLFTFNKDISTITHDFSLLIDKYNPSYREIINNRFNYKTNININLYNRIITQDIANINIFKPYYINSKNIYVAPLPDFRNSKDKIITNNKNIVIGIIGYISDIKGKILLKKIIDFYRNSKNVSIIVFGNAEISGFNNNHPYSSVDELNNTLTLYKPNILLELSIWPETYSYTLTLGMKTQLPILYFKKPFYSVIENRLKKYNKAYPFDSIDKLNELVMQNKQNYLYTIEPKIYFNVFWDIYFSEKISSNNNSDDNLIFQNSNNKLLIQDYKNIIEVNIDEEDDDDNLDDDEDEESTEKYTITDINNKINNKNVVIVTSKIYVSNNSLSYANTRSIYTPDERFIQTMNTINSIKQYIPDSFIILFDNSVFENTNYFDQIKDNVDIFLNITDNYLLNYYTDDCEFKAFAEISQILEIYKILFSKFDFNNINQFFKITGRYVINNQFNFNQYNNTKNIIKKNFNVTDRNYWYTCFYKINKNFIDTYFVRLKNILKDKNKYENMDLEVIFSTIFKDDFTFTNNLGVTQNIAVWNEINSI